jgi:TolB-like protein
VYYRAASGFVFALSLAWTAALVGCSDHAGSSASTPPPRAVSEAATPTAADAARRPHLWVLSVGVGEYRDASLRLQYAAADAQAFGAQFKQQEHGPLYDTVHTAVLLDGAATREAILQALETFLGNAAPIDVAVIFLAGHGVRILRPTAYYFLTAAATPAAPHIAGLDMLELSRQLQRLHRNIPRMVVVLDTCHAGAVTQTAARAELGTDLAPALAPAEGLYILTAARAGQRSFELEPQRHGAFTYALLDGLSGAAAGADGLISVFGLASHASRLVQQLTGDQQRPYIAMIGEDLTLAADLGRLAAITPPPSELRVARAEPAPQRDRVAIRDFDHLRPDTTNDWMRKALGQDVLMAFSELHQLDVYDEDMLRFVARDTPDVLEAAQRAGISMLVEGAYWVHDSQLNVNVQVKSVRPLQILASAHDEGPVDQFSSLTGHLVMNLLAQLSVDVPDALAERLQHPGATNLAARRLLTESDAAGVSQEPGTSRSAIPPGAFLWLFPAPSHDPVGQASLLARLLGDLFDPCRPSFAASPPDAESELMGTLEGYRKALEEKDLSTLRAYYEQLSESQRSALVDYFDAAADLRIEFSDVRVALIGDNAAVSFTRHDRFTDRGTGQPQSVTVRVTKRFTRRGNAWVIPKEP